MATPEFYQPASVGTRFVPDLDRAVSAGQAAGLSPASDDRQPTLLLLVDAQIDFIHADGALNVPGAVDDTRRTIEWLLRHAGEVTDVAASLDSHVPLQIFYSTWWRNTEGRPPDPYTPITAQQVDDGVLATDLRS